MCGLVLGLMAISASGAHAGTWMINKSNVTTAQKVEASAEIEPLGELKEKHVVILTTSGGNKVDILCTQVQNIVGTVTSTTITGTLRFSGCTTKINGVASPECVPLGQPIAAGATIETVLHEKLPYAKATGVAGVFATLKFECASLPETVKLTGTIWLEDCNKEFEVEKVTHLLQEAVVPAKALGGIKFGANAMSLDGSINVKFSDAAHLGQTLSGLAE